MFCFEFNQIPLFLFQIPLIANMVYYLWKTELQNKRYKFSKIRIKSDN
jgi:hypothetical protein